MPADNWPLETPVPAMLERVRGRATQRRRHRHARNAAVAACLAAVVVVLAASLDAMPDASRVRTTPAGTPTTERTDDGSSPEGVGPTTAAPGATGDIGAVGRRAGPGAAVPVPRSTGLFPTTTTTTTPPRPAPDVEIAFQRGQELWLMRADGSGAGRLGDGSRRLDSPDWGPDGRRLVAVDSHTDVTGKTVRHLVRVELDGSSHRLTPDGNYFRPRWSPDGSHIAFRRQTSMSSPSEVWMMRADGSDERRIEVSSSDFSWSPDGRRLVYACEQGLCTIDRDGSNRQALPNTQGISAPVWSPDGQRLAVKVHGPPETGRVDLATMRLDGTDRRVVTDGVYVYDFSWSPDGRSLVFSELDSADYGEHPQTCAVGGCDQSEGMRIFRIDVDGTDRRMLTTGGMESAPSWRPKQAR